MKQYPRALFVLLLCLSALLPTPVHAVYVDKMPVTLEQPDGREIHAYVTGDEFYRSVRDTRGYTIVQDPKTGNYVYGLLSAGKVVPSKYVAGTADPQALGLDKGIAPSAETVRSLREERLKAFPRPDRGVFWGTPSTRTINNLVIFVRFSGESEFTDPISAFEGLFNNAGAGANSLRSYYREASYNLLTINSTFYPAPSGGMVVSYMDSHPRSYYQPYSVTNPDGYTAGNANARHTALLKNAAAAIASQVPTSLNLDTNSDNLIDDVCYMFSGTSDNWADLLWPCCGSLSGDTVYINGKRVWTFNMQFRNWMFGSRAVGVLAHEMFHALGAPDLYHYDKDQTHLHPAGAWDLMEQDQNPPQHMTTFMKWKYGGWIGSIPLITTPGTYTLHPITSATNNCYKIASPYSATEYFVVEYRRKAGAFEGSVPGTGLIVYRINTAVGDGNADGPPDELYIYRPGGTTTNDGAITSANLSSVVGRTQINDYTNPKSFLTSGAVGGLDISNVGLPGDTITFQVGIGQTLTPSVSPDGGVYSTGQTVTVTCATPGATIRYTLDGSEPTTSSPVIASGGTISISYSRTIKAKAWAPSLNSSFTKTAVYGIQDRVYVDADSPGPAQDGLTWATAFHSVQDAIDVSGAGVAIWVAAGTYVENITLKDGTALYGGFAGTETSVGQRNCAKNVAVLDGGGLGSVVSIPSGASASTRIEGFTIRNGTGTTNWQGGRVGGGIWMGYSVEAKVACNIIRSNTAEQGGGIFCDDSCEAQIYNNVIFGNTAADGAGIYCRWEAGASIAGNTIAGNTASGDGGAIYLDEVTGFVTPRVKNNMIAWNSSGVCVGELNDELIVENNCLWGNAAYAYQGIADPTGTNGNISAYPLFADSAAGDYHLRAGSGGIDGGSNMNLPSIYDRDGGSRAWDGNQDGTALADCGAYEFRRIYVKGDSPGPQNGSTWAKAYHSVQAGLDAAVWPDEVWVARGTYFERVTLKDGVAMYGGFAGTETSSMRFWWQNETILDGSGNSGSVVTVPAGSGAATRLDGFTVRNGSGAATRLDGFTVRNGSGAAWGGGIWCGNGSAPTITNNRIGPNAAQYGGGIYCTGSSASIAGNLFVSNTASQAGGGAYLAQSPVTLSYNTFAANSAVSGGGGIAYFNGNPTLSSNIVAFNSQGIYGITGTATISSNNVYGNTAGNYMTIADQTGSNDNISDDPLFAAREDGDYHLTDGSPSVDTALHADPPPSDLDGRGRNCDGDGDEEAAADMGAYEFRRIYVKWDSSAGMYDGATWNTAYHTIAGGLDASRHGDEIWVAAGVYPERITLKSGVALYGGFAGGEVSRSLRNWPVNVTTIEAGNAGRAVTAPDGSPASTRIDGFTIQHGQTTLPGAGIYVGQQSRIDIRNNRILSNVSSNSLGASGGGIYSHIASPTIANNLIAGNSATGSIGGTFRGGGLCLYGGTPTVVNNTIAGNTAGGLRISGDGGGIYLDSTSAVIRNSIVAFNSSGICKNASGAPSLDHNDVYGNTSYNYSNVTPGAGSISADPIFADRSGGDYRLLTGSPCIDAGSAAGAPPADMDGLIRPMDGNGDGSPQCDIGAWEASANPALLKESLADGAPVCFSGVSVTACFAGDLVHVYVEKPDRSFGIRVSAGTGPFPEGTMVKVKGVMATDWSGERYVNAIDGWALPTGGSLIIDPLGLPNRALGGSANGLQIGLPDSVGRNNLGLLVRTWGRVTAADYGLVAIDDGSGRNSYMTGPGVQANLWAAGGRIWPGQVVQVTGISSINRVSETERASVVLPRQASDVVVLRTPTLYIRGSNTETANSVKALLDGEGFPTDIISNTAVAAADLSKYALIIIGQDSGTWTDASAVAKLNNSGRPIVGIETGGAQFFGKLSLGIAVNSYAQGNAMMARLPSSPIYYQPYEITISPAGAVTVSTNASGWYGYQPMGAVPWNVEAFGSQTTNSACMMLMRENDRYLYWPFRDRPSLLTDDGRRLFVNACWYALR